MSINEFFKDKHGKTVIIQPPNLLISIWAVLQVFILVTGGKISELQVLATAVLFAWAYLELTQGDSPFRKALGGLVIVIILVMLFVF